MTRRNVDATIGAYLRLTFKEDFRWGSRRNPVTPRLFRTVPLRTVFPPEIRVCCVTLLIVLLMNVDEKKGAISQIKLKI